MKADQQHSALEVIKKEQLKRQLKCQLKRRGN